MSRKYANGSTSVNHHGRRTPRPTQSDFHSDGYAEQQDHLARLEGPKRKTWSRHDLKNVKPLTPAQEEMMYDFLAGNNILASGCAGTGKSFIALFLAANEVLRFESTAQRIILIRSAVPTREVGFLPGTLEEKNAVYEQPYQAILAELFGRSTTYADMKAAGYIEFVTTSFLRGLTWDNAVIVFDEAQNANWEEINTVMTRIGRESRIIICGDTRQNDLLYRKSDTTGFAILNEVANHMSAFSNIQFTQHDIVRSEFVKEFIIACEELKI